MESTRRTALYDSAKSAIRKAGVGYPIRRVAIFGSVARGEDGPESDVDILVETAPGASLLDLSGFRDDVKRATGREVDLVSSLRGASRAFVNEVSRDGVVVYQR